PSLAQDFAVTRPPLNLVADASADQYLHQRHPPLHPDVEVVLGRELGRPPGPCSPSSSRPRSPTPGRGLRATRECSTGPLVLPPTESLAPNLTSQRAGRRIGPGPGPRVGPRGREVR